MKLVFDLQLFGGKGSSTTNVQTYTPTQYELQLQRASANYADAVSPNALWLNNVGRNLLQNSLGTVQVDFNGMNRNAQNQIANATSNLSAIPTSNNAATTAANNTLSNISGQYGTLANQAATGINNLSELYSPTSTNNTLSSTANTVNRAASTANNALQQAASANTQAGNNATGVLTGLAQGKLPDGYQQGMENSIKTTLNRTIGDTINSMGNRGVLNSSVTTDALNDISRNAADSVAQQYQNNINQVANLGQQQFGNSMAVNSANANLAQQQMGNTANAAQTQANATQQQFANNQSQASGLGSLIQQAYTMRTGALDRQGDAALQQLQNTQNNNAQNANIYGSLINNATAPITTAAAAQEAAQSPAINMWNASLGLNSATTGALNAAAGKGTTTSTSTTSGGTGFLGSLIGGMAMGYGGGMANAWGQACFTAGTKITMADGGEKNIEDIQLGDKVKTATGTGEVVSRMKPHTNDVFILTTEKGKVTQRPIPAAKPSKNSFIGNTLLGTGSITRYVK